MNWKEEKKADLIEAFVRVMQGEPADGGNSQEETREYLTEFKNDLLSSEREEIAELLEKSAEFTQAGAAVTALHVATTAIRNRK